MTPNEKKVLAKLKEIKQGNTVTVAGTLRVTISYAHDVCNKLSQKGYLEKLSPGRFALYKITSLGEKQVQTDVRADTNEEIKAEEFECVTCGAAVKQDDTECPKCGISFEEIVEEEMPGSVGSSRNEQALQSVRNSSVVLGIHSAERADSESEKTAILNHASVPEDWKTCNWNWK